MLFFVISGQTYAQVVGKIEHFRDFPSSLIKPRNVDVWLPEDYNQKEKYAVLYMHDGQMLFEAKNLGVDETLMQLMKDNKIRKTIVVGIWNTDDYRHSEYFPQKPLAYLPQEKRQMVVKRLLKDNPQADNYLAFIVKELKPFIDKKFSTQTDPQNTFMAGVSMGGLISLYAISEYPEVFGGVACISTHFIGGFDLKDTLIPTAFNEYFRRNLPASKNHRIYFDHGNRGFEFFYAPFQKAINEIMKEKGYTAKNWETKVFDGDEHETKFWARRLPIPLEFLLKQ